MSRYSGHDGGGRREPERWDPERFNRERGGRQQAPQVIERDIYEEHDRLTSPPPRRPQRAFDDFDYPPPPGRRGDRFEEKDRFYHEERYGPPARRAPRQERHYEEEDFDDFEESERGVKMMPARRGPPRPGMIRRQSSLDTFDRKPLPRYPRQPPEVIKMPAPGRRRKSPTRYERDFEEIRVAEPDYYGDEEFRGYKEREIITDRRRRPSPPRFEERFEEVERERETFEVEEEKPFPRRGKTKMPARLVNKRVIIDLGYPFEEEGETVIILKALGKEHIDEVINLSKEMNRGASRTTYMIEAPPPQHEEIIERREIVVPAPPAEVPRSVKEWDVMSGALGGGHSDHGGGHSDHGGGHSTHGGKSQHGGKSHHGGGKSHGGHSTHGGKSHHGGKSAHGGKSRKGGHSESSGDSSDDSDTVIIEKRVTRSKSRHRSKSVGGHGAVIEEVGESNALNTSPLALVLPHREKERSNRDERDIKAEIKALEAEKRKLKHEREHEKHHRRSSKYRHDEDEVIIERREKERDVKIEKDRKGNMAFVR